MSEVQGNEDDYFEGRFLLALSDPSTGEKRAWRVDVVDSDALWSWVKRSGLTESWGSPPVARVGAFSGCYVWFTGDGPTLRFAAEEVPGVRIERADSDRPSKRRPMDVETVETDEMTAKMLVGAYLAAQVFPDGLGDYTDELVASKVQELINEAHGPEDEPVEFRIGDVVRPVDEVKDALGQPLGGTGTVVGFTRDGYVLVEREVWESGATAVERFASIELLLVERPDGPASWSRGRFQPGELVVCLHSEEDRDQTLGVLIDLAADNRWNVSVLALRPTPNTDWTFVGFKIQEFDADLIGVQPRLAGSSINGMI